MHPNAAFRWDDPEAVREFVREIAFADIFAATPDGLRVAQVPVIWAAENRIWFHLSRGNALARHLDGLEALALLSGPDAYISPDWYGAEDHVPTWNYLSAEIEGLCRKLDTDEVMRLLDALTAEHEARIEGKAPWTREKMSAGKFDQMLRGISGFELEISAIRTTAKLGQNKPAAERLSAAKALKENGQIAMAALMKGWNE